MDDHAALETFLLSDCVLKALNDSERPPPPSYVAPRSEVLPLSALAYLGTAGTYVHQTLTGRIQVKIGDMTTYFDTFVTAESECGKFYVNNFGQIFESSLFVHGQIPPNK